MPKHPTPTKKRRGGRPSQAEAPRIRERILEIAAELFFAEGYGAASIEAVARRAGISKRTLYARFRDKADLFAAVVHHVIGRLRPAHPEKLFEGGSAEEILRRLASLILHAALTSDALALYRTTVAEAARFPELAAVMSKSGGRQEAIGYIARLLEKATAGGELRVKNPVFAAEQFLQLVVSAPQRRALGLGEPMTQAELDGWARDAADLFLNGCRK